MAGYPDTNLQPSQPEQDHVGAWIEQRIVTTQSGDYAEGDIDKRTSIVYSAPREAPLPAFQVPYQAIPLVGRTEALAELEALLSADAAVALSSAVAGMAGVGKTLLAATFARQHQAAFPGGIFWLNMEQPDQIAGQVAACAGPGGLDLLEFPALAFADRIARVQAAWNSPLRRLLVFDNLEDPALLERWQPTGGGTQVLITTRRDAWSRQVRRLRLPVLPRPQSIELLLGARSADLDVPFAALLADSAEHDAASEICDLLGDLPLALAIAAALLRLSPSITLQHLCAQIAADPLFTDQADTMDLREALREAGLPTGRALGVVATFAISYRQLQADSEVDASALRMLHAAAYCASAPIPQLMLWWVAGFDSTTEIGRAKGDAATRRLRALGFIASPALDSLGTITLHRLLAAFVRRQSHPQDLLGVTVAVACSFTHSMQEAGQIKLSMELVPHIETLLTAQTRTLGAEHPDTLSTTHNLANALSRQGDYAAARARYEAVLAIRTRTLGAEHPATLSTTHNLANALEGMGRWHAATSLRVQVFNAYEQRIRTEPLQSLKILTALNHNLGSRGYQRATRQRLKAWRTHLPDGMWRSAVQVNLFVTRTRAVLTAVLLGWIASSLAGYTGYGPLLSVVVVLIAMLSYWFRWALIALFGLASVALIALLSSGLPAPWPQLYSVLAALLGAMLVPYGAPAFAWLLSVTKLRILAQPIQRRIAQLQQRILTWSQAAAAQDDQPAQDD